MYMRKLILLMIVLITLTLTGCLGENNTFVDSEDDINDGHEYIIKEFRSHHDYSYDELKELDIKYLGDVDNFSIYYVEYEKESGIIYPEGWNVDGFIFPSQSHTRIMGISGGKLYVLGKLIHETSINVEALYWIMPDEYKEVIHIDNVSLDEINQDDIDFISDYVEEEFVGINSVYGNYIIAVYSVLDSYGYYEFVKSEGKLTKIRKFESADLNFMRNEELVWFSGMVSRDIDDSRQRKFYVFCDYDESIRINNYSLDIIGDDGTITIGFSNAVEVVDMDEFGEFKQYQLKDTDGTTIKVVHVVVE